MPARDRDRLRLSAIARQTVLQDCARRAPDEACGALLGSARNDYRVDRAVPLTNQAPTPGTAYRIAPADLFRLERAATGDEVLGFYHSHPHAPAQPSPTDLELAWPGYLYLIVGVAAGEPDLRAWRLYDDRSAFEPIELTCPD